jgi:hypothetical protein
LTGTGRRNAVAVGHEADETHFLETHVASIAVFERARPQMLISERTL